MQKQLSKELSQKFILAGKAFVTFKSIKTNKHFTYRITKKKNNDIWFVNVMYDYNTRSFNYLGCILPDKTFTHTKASQAKKTSSSWIAFKWAWNNLNNNLLEVWHEGRCGRCGRLLTEPDSIAAGFGPICRGIINSNN